MTGLATDDALQRLRQRDEILEICFWFQGEGFGEVFTPKALVQFLSAGEDVVRIALDELVDEGHLSSQERGYGFTKAGRQRAGRMFAESFVDFQRPAHGECDRGCCEGDEHDHEHEH